MEARDYVLGLLSAGLTQLQIEERTGVPQPTVSKIARGEVADVFSKTYRALQALHADVVPAKGVVAAPVSESPPGAADAGPGVWRGVDRRQVQNPPPPDLERREHDAAALAGQGVPG